MAACNLARQILQAAPATVPGKEGLQLVLRCIGQLADKRHQENPTSVSGRSPAAAFFS